MIKNRGGGEQRAAGRVILQSGHCMEPDRVSVCLGEVVSDCLSSLTGLSLSWPMSFLTFSSFYSLPHPISTWGTSELQARVSPHSSISSPPFRDLLMDHFWISKKAFTSPEQPICSSVWSQSADLHKVMFILGRTQRSPEIDCSWHWNPSSWPHLSSRYFHSLHSIKLIDRGYFDYGYYYPSFSLNEAGRAQTVLVWHKDSKGLRCWLLSAQALLKPTSAGENMLLTGWVGRCLWVAELYGFPI